MNDWLGLLATPAPAKTTPKNRKNARRKVAGRSPEQKDALALRICNQMFRQVPYPALHMTLERINDEAQMTIGQAKKFVKEYMKTNNIQPEEVPDEEV